jgi:hypothetical protein
LLHSTWNKLESFEQGGDLSFTTLKIDILYEHLGSGIIAVMEFPMKLVVGQDGVEIETIPEVMANASSVFRCMLRPNRFVEGHGRSQTKPFVILLEEDDASAMKIICDIFHLRSNKIPIEDMTPDTMANLATLVDKYDCAATIQPWPKLWLSQVLGRRDHLDVGSMSLPEVGKWIHISCQLGFKEHFRQCTAAFISRASREDFAQGPLLLDYRKLSQTIQGRFPTESNNTLTDDNRRYRRCSNRLYPGVPSTMLRTYRRTQDRKPLQVFMGS